MDVATLQTEIEKVCPVISVTIEDEDDRSTWSFVPAPEATPEQITAGNEVIATIPIGFGQPALASSDFIGRFTNAEYRAAATTWRQTAGNAKNWDVVVFDPIINIKKKKTITLRDSLVADGILTQARADEIFS